MNKENPAPRSRLGVVRAADLGLHICTDTMQHTDTDTMQHTDTDTMQHTDTDTMQHTDTRNAPSYARTLYIIREKDAWLSVRTFRVFLPQNVKKCFKIKEIPPKVLRKVKQIKKIPIKFARIKKIPYLCKRNQ